MVIGRGNPNVLIWLYGDINQFFLRLPLLHDPTDSNRWLEQVDLDSFGARVLLFDSLAFQTRGELVSLMSLFMNRLETGLVIVFDGLLLLDLHRVSCCLDRGMGVSIKRFAWARVKKSVESLCSVRPEDFHFLLVKNFDYS